MPFCGRALANLSFNKKGRLNVTNQWLCTFNTESLLLCDSQELSKEFMTAVLLWKETLLYLYRGRETTCIACLWQPYHFPLGAHWFMTVTFISRSYSFSRWWMGWSRQHAKIGLLPDKLLQCNSPPSASLSVCARRWFSTSTLSPLLSFIHEY